MGWYRCSCGFMAKATPRFGDSIVSVSHLHQAGRVDGTSSIVRMEEITDPAIERENPRTAPTRTAREASASPRPVAASRPGRRAA
jgi:hypothetical protein